MTCFNDLCSKPNISTQEFTQTLQIPDNHTKLMTNYKEYNWEWFYNGFSTLSSDYKVLEILLYFPVMHIK